MIISSKKELLQEIDNMLGLKAHKTIDRIAFICPNMNSKFIAYDGQSPQNLGQEILKKLQQTQNNTTIHSFETLSQEQISGTKQPYNLQKHITIKTYHNDNIIKALLDSIEESVKIDTTKQYQNLEAMLDDIKSENIDKISLKKAKDVVIKHIGELLIESNLFADMMKGDAKSKIEQLFNKLEQYIKQAIEDKNKDYYKNIIKTIFNVILAIAVGGGAAIILLGISAALLSSLMDYQDTQNNKYSYIKNPIIEFLATELAMYIQLINTRLLSCILIVETKEKIEFIDLSGFNLELDNTLLSCFQPIAFRGEFDNSLDIPSFLKQENIILPTIQHNSMIAEILHIYQPKLNTKNDNKTSQKASSQTANQQQNINNTPLLSSILKEAQHFNHLAYIESPHFNSALLAEIFNNKNAQYPSNHTTNMAKNYLFITNAPSKYNAKLTETITQHIISNKIKDDINNRTKQNLKIDYQNKKSSYNTKRDYNSYRIEINKKNDEPYLLQLSPFVRVDSVDIEESCKNSDMYKQAQGLLQMTERVYNRGIYSPYSPGNMTAYSSINKREAQLNDIKKIYGIDYINQFFKTPKEIEDIIKKEEQIAKDFLTQLQQFHNNNKNLDNSLLAIFSLFYGLYVFKIHFPSFMLESEVATKTYSDTYLSSKTYDYLQVSCLNATWQFHLTHQQDSIGYIKPLQNAQIAKVLQEQLLLQTQNPQKIDNKEINLSQEFLDHLKEFIDTRKTDEKVQAFYNEIKKEIENNNNLFLEIGLDNEIQKKEEEIKTYGKQYVSIMQKERTQEIFYTSVLKILGAICPFINFTHENMIDTTKHCIAIFITALENHLGKNKTLKIALYDTFLAEMGLFSFLLHPTTIRVHIGINESAKEIAEKEAKKTSFINNKIEKFIDSLNLKNKEQIQSVFRGFAQVELRHTKAQVAYFEAKTAFILDSIDKDSKTLKLAAIKEKLKQTMTSAKDKALIDKICFTYSSGKAQSHLIGEIQMRETFYQIKHFYRNKITYTFKTNLGTALADILLGIVLEYYFSTNYEAYAREYDSMMHKRYTFYYDLPYAVKRKESVLEIHENQTRKKDKELTYYPMIVMAKFMSFDLQSMFYGTELCTGGLTHHLGLVHHLRQNNSNALQEFLLKRLLSYLIIDEKREAKSKEDYELHYNRQVPDYTFFNHKSIDSKGNIIDKTSHISLDNILKYQVPENSSLYQKFKDLERKGVASAIDAYNEALAILADYKDYYFTNTRSGELDKNKARRLLECLNTIGENNVRALYVGTSNASKKMKRPKFIGRLATTIIIEDGLWLG